MERKKVEFSYEKKGYSPEQVDEYIDHLLAMYDNLEKEHSDLERKYRAMQIKLEEAKSDESTISSIIVSAQKMADSIVDGANKKAKAINDSVSESCNEILDNYARRVAAERDKLLRVEQAVADFKNTLYGAYKEHLSMIDQIMPDKDESSESLSQATDEQLMDAAFELTKQKYDESAEEEVELISRRNSSEVDNSSDDDLSGNK